MNIPGLTGSYHGGYAGSSAGLGSGFGGSGYAGEAGKGSRPFLDINGQSPRTAQGHPSIRGHLANNPKLGDDAMEMIAEIENKALIEIDALKREKADLIRRLNQ